jgi:hypothetical protein
MDLRVVSKQRMDTLLREKERQQHLASVHKDTLRKIAFLKKKTVIEARDVYTLVQEFFKEFLEKHQEFTMTELRKELREVYISNSTRQTIAKILDRLGTMEYTTVHYSREDLCQLLDDVQHVIDQLIAVHAARNSVFGRIKSMFFKPADAQTIITELPFVEQTDADGLRLYILIEKCYAHLDKHQLHKAKAAYEDLLAEYSRLESAKQAQYFPLLEQTYSDLLNRAAMMK